MVVCLNKVDAVDDPELFKYPIAYMTEAGFWELTDVEAAAFRAYLQKGGFVIFDDFRSDFRGGGGWANFEANMRRVLPEVRKWLETPAEAPAPLKTPALVARPTPMPAD